MKIAIKLALCMWIVAGLSTATSAGGLFGEGGLIRGDVGKLLNKTIEKPVLTPLGRKIEQSVRSSVEQSVSVIASDTNPEQIKAAFEEIYRFDERSLLVAQASDVLLCDTFVVFCSTIGAPTLRSFIALAVSEKRRAEEKVRHDEQAKINRWTAIGVVLGSLIAFVSLVLSILNTLSTKKLQGLASKEVRVQSS